ncbi:MAG TPA: LptA/OstA family protein [Candidatus Binatia bacterium]
MKAVVVTALVLAVAVAGGSAYAQGTTQKAPPRPAGAAAPHKEDAAHKTDDMLDSVATAARDLEMADVPSPVDISADRMEYNYGQGLLHYEGNVVVDHAGARIKSRSLDVTFEPGGQKRLKKITARGSVELTRGDESAHGEVAEYEPTTATVTLTQNARLGSGPNSVAGEKVVVYLNEKRAVVLGGGAPATASAAAGEQGAGPAAAPGRIRAILMPDSLNKEVQSGKSVGKTEPAKPATTPNGKAR